MPAQGTSGFLPVTAPREVSCASWAEAQDVEYYQGKAKGQGHLSDKGQNFLHMYMGVWWYGAPTWFNHNIKTLTYLFLYPDCRCALV